MRYYFVGFILFIISFVIISDKFDLIDSPQPHRSLIKSIEDKFNIKISANGKSFLKFLPMPKIIISDLNILYDGQTIFKGNHLTLDISFLSLIKTFIGNDSIPDISILDFKEGYINYDLLQQYFSDHSNIQNELFPQDLILKFTKLETNYGSRKVDINDIQLNFVHGNKINSSGDIIVNQEKINCNLDVALGESGSDIKVVLEHRAFNLNLSLEEFSYSDLKLKNGKIDLKIIDLRRHFNDQKSELDNDFGFSSTINYNQEQQEITLESTTFEGQVIAKPSLEAKLYKVSDDIVELQLKLSADTLYLDRIKDNIRFSELSINELMQYILDLSSMSGNSNFDIDVDIKKINIEESIIRNFYLSTYTVMGRTLIEKLYLNLPGESQFILSGTIFGNEIRKKLNGYVEIKSDDMHELVSWYKGANSYNFKKSKQFYLSTPILAMQNIFKASDLNIRIDDALSSANITLYDIPYSAPVKRFFVQSKNLDLDDIGFTTALDMHIKKLYEADDDKSGEKYFKLTTADSWLRNFNRQVSIDLTVHNLNFRNKRFEKVNTIIETSSSLLNIKSLSFEDEKLNGVLKFKFKLPVLRPQIILKADFNYVDLNFLSSLLPSEKYLGKYDPSDNSINFYSANSYDGRFDVNIGQLKINNETMFDKFSTNGTLKLGYLSVNDMNFNVWNGDVKSNFGIFISTNKPTFNLSFNAYSINPHLPMKYITSLDKMQGYMSIAGILKGNLREWGNNELYGKAQFAGALISLDGFNLNQIVQITDGDYTKESKLQAIDYYSQYGQSVFDTMTGGISIVNGLVKIENMELKTKRISGAASVNYDLTSKDMSSMGAFAFIPINSTKTIIITTKSSGKLPVFKENIVDISKVKEFIKKPSNN